MSCLLLGAAVVAFGGALMPGASAGMAVLAFGIALAALVCWRLAGLIAADVANSRAWAEVGLLRAELERREALWRGLPGPVVAWDDNGQLLVANDAWRQLGLPTDAIPDQAELSIGDPPRVFVVERAELVSGARVVLLREVTRERQALQAKDELLAIVGHELRTPLSAIKGYGHLMARQLATVQEQVQRLDELISDVLDAARVDTGRLNLRREPLSLRQLLDGACERFGAAHPTRKLVLDARADGLIQGDVNRLGQVLDNLLSNATKYSAADTTITVQCDLDGEWARIAVRDHGVGIAAEHLPRLFERFYRVRGDAAAAQPGFGLGLSIVRDLVEAHGGGVEAISDGPGTGSTFSITLPLALAIGTGAERPQTPSPA
jgi:signal transduction histidine kinase